MGYSTRQYSEPTTDKVEIESSAVIKILSHCSDNYPNAISGVLLGLDNGSTLNVSHAYPVYSYIQDGNLKLKLNSRYVNNLIEELESVGYATQVMGWYQSTIANNFLTEDTMKFLMDIQISKNINSVLLVNDSAKLKKGVLSLRAYRVSAKFIQTYLQYNNKITSKGMTENELTFKDLLTEVPVHIHNTQLISLFLADLQAQDDFKLDELSTNNLIDLKKHTKNAKNAIGLQLSNNNEILKFNQSESFNWKMNKLQGSIDAFNYLQRQYAKELSYLESRKHDDKPREQPNRYESLIVSSNINSICNDLELECTSELTKHFAVKAGLEH